MSKLNKKRNRGIACQRIEKTKEEEDCLAGWQEIYKIERDRFVPRDDVK